MNSECLQHLCGKMNSECLPHLCGKMNSECLPHLCGKINFECLQHLCGKMNFECLQHLCGKMNSECLQHLCGKINFECLQHLCRKTTTFNACSTYVEKYKLRELTALSCPGLITPFVCRYGATQVYVVLVSFTYKILTTTYSVHKSCKRDFRSFKNTTSFVASHVGGPSQLVWLYIFNIALSHDYAAHSKYLSEQDFQLSD